MKRKGRNIIHAKDDQVVNLSPAEILGLIIFLLDGDNKDTPDDESTSQQITGFIERA